jgi:glutaminase
MTGSTNHALRSLMLANGRYPEKSNFEMTKKLADDGLDWYFVQCSMLVDVEGIARFGAMLANNGINPSTGERIIEPQTVKATVTLMQTCGMYNGAGKFTKDHGLPSKSGVSGGLMTVIPGLGAIGSFSPPLNEEGNCVRGIGMIEKLSKTYLNFNLFFKDPIKRDLTRRAHQTIVWTVIAGINASSSGDIETFSRLLTKGLQINAGDYDKRTPMHLAAANGHLDMV